MPVAKVFSHSSKLLRFVMLGRDSANCISALATDSILDFDNCIHQEMECLEEKKRA